MTPPPAIVLGVDTPIGLAVVRELGRHGVPVHGIGRSDRAIGGASRHLAGFSTRGAGALADWLPQRIAKVGAAALLAVSEDDLVALAALGPVIAGCRILTPRAAPLGIVLDKARTLAIAAGLGIGVPDSWQPVAGGDRAEVARLRWPVVVKWPDPIAVAPLLAAAGLPLVKAEYCADAGALHALLDRYEAIGELPLVQGYCPGTGVGQMLHMAGGRATLRFQHERLHEWPPEGGVSTLCRALLADSYAAQMAKSEALLAAIGWNGPAMVEYRHDAATGRFVLMEVNGRFWGSQPLALACGAEFAWEQYRRAVLGETGDAPPPRAGRRARFMIPETRRLARVLFARGRIRDPAYHATPLRDLAGYVAGFVDPRMRYYVFSPGDPGPFLRDMANVIAAAAGRRAR